MLWYFDILFQPMYSSDGTQCFQIIFINMMEIVKSQKFEEQQINKDEIDLQFLY